MRAIKKENAHFTIWKKFQRGKDNWKETSIHIISQTTNKSYIIWDYSLYLAINSYYYKKENYR